MKSFQASVFTGSSLVATVEDIRSFLDTGQEVFLNKLPYLTHKTKYPSKWTARTVELSSDYTGDTNLEAEISFMPKMRPVRKLKPIEKKVEKEKEDGEDGQVADSLDALPPLTVPSGIAAKSAKRQNSKKSLEKKDAAAEGASQTGTGRKAAPSIKAEQEQAATATGSSAVEGTSGTISIAVGTVQTNTSTLPGKAPRQPSKPKPSSASASASDAKDSRGRAPARSARPATHTPSAVPKGQEEEGEEGDEGESLPPKSSLEDARRLAQERVLRKLQEDRRLVEQREKDRERAIQEREEKNTLKIKTLAEKTQERVQKYLEEKEKKRAERERKEQEKLLEREEDQEKAERGEYSKRVRKLEREALERLRRFQERELRQIEEKEEEMKMKLKEVKEKREKDTTYRVRQRGKAIVVHDVDEEEDMFRVYSNEEEAFDTNQRHKLRRKKGGEADEEGEGPHHVHNSQHSHHTAHTNNSYRSNKREYYINTQEDFNENDYDNDDSDYDAANNYKNHFMGGEMSDEAYAESMMRDSLEGDLSPNTKYILEQEQDLYNLPYSNTRPITTGSADIPDPHSCSSFSMPTVHNPHVPLAMPMVGTRLAFPPQPQANKSSQKSPSKPPNNVRISPSKSHGTLDTREFNPDLLYDTQPPSTLLHNLLNPPKSSAHDDSSSDEDPRALEPPLSHRRDNNLRAKNKLSGESSSSSGLSHVSDITTEDSPNRQPKYTNNSQHRSDQKVTEGKLVKKSSHSQHTNCNKGRSSSNHKKATADADLSHKASLPLIEAQHSQNNGNNDSKLEQKSQQSNSTKKSKPRPFKRLEPIPIAPYQPVQRPL